MLRHSSAMNCVVTRCRSVNHGAVRRSIDHLFPRQRIPYSGKRAISRCLSSRMAAPVKRKNAAIIVIGNELLRGEVLDTNCNYICKRLFDVGIRVAKVSVIGDDLDEIADEVSLFSAKYDLVFTSGGVGPTHDDVTYAGVAKAFGVDLEPNPLIVTMIENYFTPEKREVAMKMALVPKNATLLVSPKGKKERFPLVVVDNVFVLPGIPVFFERSFSTWMDNLDPGAVQKTLTAALFVDLDEVNITGALNSVVPLFKDRVTFGSYPKVSHNYFQVKLTMESTDEKALEEAKNLLLERLPQDSVVEYSPEVVTTASRNVYDLVKDGSDELSGQVKSSVGVIEECLERYTPEEVCISFNGGKDCSALLYLVYAVLQNKFPGRKSKLKAVYFKSETGFPEVEQFIRKCTVKYDLDLITLPFPIRIGLQKLTESKPELKVVIVGNRRTDPHSESLEPFKMTDADWPQIMRVCPLLDWDYSQVWGFLRKLYLPYCSLYDRGYTSLGSTMNTVPNPHLKYTKQNGSEAYLPAYRLKDGALERDGRT